MLTIPEELRLAARQDSDTCLRHRLEYPSRLACCPKCREESEALLLANCRAGQRREREANGESYALPEVRYVLPEMEEEEGDVVFPTLWQTHCLVLVFFLLWALCALLIVPQNRRMEQEQRMERKANP